MRKVGKRKFGYDNVASGEWRCGGNYKKVLERDNYQCAICGSCNYILVHHLNGNLDDNKLDNLLTLCKSHHAELHGQTLSVKKPRKDLIDELREQGKTFEKIGNYLGISRQRVHQIVNKIAT